MKKILILAALSCCCLTSRASYPSWVDMSNYVATALSGFSPTNSGSGSSLPTTATNAPNIYWTNSVNSFWITNAGFNLGQVGLPSSNQYSAQFTLSNSSASAITFALPFTAYSISQATNVTGATVPAGSALNLAFHANPNGVIYVVDNGENNQALLSLAAAVAGANGLLQSTFGSVTSTTNPVVWTVSAANAVYANYFNNYPGTQSGMQFQSFDALGNVWLNLFNRNGLNGMAISNATLDLADFNLFGSSGASAGTRFEHRTPNLIFSGNTAGELQVGLGGLHTAVWGNSASWIPSPIYTPLAVVTNLDVSGGFITNGNTVFCTATNLPMQTNQIYITSIGAGGWIYVSTNNGTTNVWSRH